MSFGGLFRRVEQGLLQSVGLVKSSMDEDDTYRQENARLEALDGCLRRLAEAAQAHMMSLTRSATAVLGYVKELDTSLAALPGPPGGGGAMEQGLHGCRVHSRHRVVIKLEPTAATTAPTTATTSIAATAVSVDGGQVANVGIVVAAHGAARVH